MSRPALLMLVPHEPERDPRIHYTAESLAGRFDVTVLAALQPWEAGPSRATPGTYAIARVRARRARIPGALAAFLLLALRGRSVGAGFVLLLRALGILVALAPFLLFWIATKPWGGAERLAPGLAAATRLAALTLASCGALAAHVRANRQRPAVVYCHDLYTLQLGVQLKRRLGCGLVYDSHEFYPFLDERWPFPRLARFYESVLVRSADLYLTVSPQLARALERFYGVAGVAVLPNVEPQPPQPVVALDAGIAATAGSRLRVLYQGSFAPDRGLEEVLREWRGVDGTRAALFLRGPRNAARDRLEAMATELGLLGASVFVMAPVHEHELIRAAAEADVGLIPYKADSPAYRFACPNKLSQYVHAGIAVLGNRIPFVEELVLEHGIGAVYSVGRPGELAAAVNALAADRDRLERMREAARRLSRSSYHWNRYEPAFLQQVSRVATGAQPCAA